MGSTIAFCDDNAKIKVDIENGEAWNRSDTTSNNYCIILYKLI